jgi:hypothetical protein
MSSPVTGSRLCSLTLADPDAAWARLGFDVTDSRLDLGGVQLMLDAPGRGIVGWAISGIDGVKDIDGLAVEAADASDCGPSASASHPNGATGIDHVVLLTPAFDRTAEALEQAGLPLRRVTDEIRPGVRQGFRRLGAVILELVHAPGAERVHLWGLTVTVEDLDALAARLGPELGKVKPAVQRGQRIATLRAAAGLSTAVAFMDAAG